MALIPSGAARQMPAGIPGRGSLMQSRGAFRADRVVRPYNRPPSAFAAKKFLKNFLEIAIWLFYGTLYVSKYPLLEWKNMKEV